MARLIHRHVTEEARLAGPGAPAAPANRPDWRGWIALAWVVFWGSAYALMAIQARAPEVLRWVMTLTRKAVSS
jgi:hypothetical protein